MKDAVVGGKDVMQSFFWRNYVCDGVSKDEKLVQLGISVRYTVIVILWVKIQGGIGVYHINMESG